MTKLKVTGMTCGHCVKGVTAAIAAVAGVDKVVEVSLERGEAIVQGDADPAELVRAVKEDGYEAEVIS